MAACQEILTRWRARDHDQSINDDEVTLRCAINVAEIDDDM